MLQWIEACVYNVVKSERDVKLEEIAARACVQAVDAKAEGWLPGLILRIKYLTP